MYPLDFLFPLNVLSRPSQDPKFNTFTMTFDLFSLTNDYHHLAILFVVTISMIIKNRILTMSLSQEQ